MAYPEGEVMVPVEGFAGVDEGELEAGDELVQLGQVVEGAARSSWWPSGFAWIFPLLVGAAVGAGLLWAATAEGDGAPW